MITEKQVKEKAAEKFGSLTRFGKTVGIQALDIYAVFRMKEGDYKQQKMKAIMSTINKSKARKLDDDWRPGLGAEVREVIIKKFGTVTAFCNKHPEFKNYWISLVLNDKKVRVSNKVKKMFKILKFDYVK